MKNRWPDMPILRGRMKDYIEREKKLISIAAVTRIPFGDVEKRMSKASIHSLELILKIAALTGELISPEQASEALFAQAMAAALVGKTPPSL